MRRRRVKITGIGPVTPAGIGLDAFRTGIFENRSCARKYESIRPALGEFVAASIPDFRLNNYIEKFPGQHGTARHTQFGIAAAILALRDAGITSSDFERTSRSLLVTGTSLMDCEGLKRSYDQVAKLGVKGAYTRAVYSANVASIPATIGTVLNINPQMIAVQSSCCSGLDAIGYATKEIALGNAEIALCGGTEAPLFEHPMVELRAAGLMSGTSQNAEMQCRPFDLWRSTGVVGEGACMFVLEPESSKRSPYAFIEGYGSASDYDNRSCSGMSNAMLSALKNADKHYRDIDAVNAWGPGHKLIDKAEALALIEVFREHLEFIGVYSIKGAIGNPLGAAGAIQMAASAVCLVKQWLPPTVNWEYPDPQCQLNLSRRSIAFTHRLVLVNSHGISGGNSSIVLSRD